MIAAGKKLLSAPGAKYGLSALIPKISAKENKEHEVFVPVHDMDNKWVRVNTDTINQAAPPCQTKLRPLWGTHSGGINKYGARALCCKNVKKRDPHGAHDPKPGSKCPRPALPPDAYGLRINM